MKYIMTERIRIQAIYITPKAGMSMQSMEFANLIAGHGIQGDRYALHTGAYSQHMPQKIRHISLISQNGIDIANAWLKARNKACFNASETRRNILLNNISAIELNHLVGKTFLLGNIRCRGVELCAPCQRPAELLNKTFFMNAFEGHGGLRAEVLETGNIKIGDTFDSVSTEN